MPDRDPAQAIRDAIEHLETSTEPVQAQIDQVRKEADEKVAELEARIAVQHAELQRWRAALDRAQGRTQGRTPETPAKRRRTPTFSVDDDQLQKALRAAEEPLSAGQLREALQLDRDVLASQLTRLLGDAVRRGVITRSGERRATRYAAP